TAFSYVLLRDDASHLQVDDRVPVDAEVGEDRVAVLVELGGPLGLGGLAAELDRRRRELERDPVRRLELGDVAVGRGLWIDRRRERVLHDGPLSGEVVEA